MRRQPIPDGARLTYRGAVFTVYQWDQPLFDGSTAVFERATRPDSVQVLPIKDGKILVAREEQPDTKPFWGLFGGVIDPGEDPLTAAKRELLEETGLVSDEWELLTTIEFDDKLHWKIPYYVARGCRQADDPHQEPGERIEAVPVDFPRLVDILCDPECRARALAFHVLLLERAGKLDEFRRKLGV